MRIIPSSSMAKSLMEFDSKIFNQQVVISGVSINAQKVVPGDLFIAFAGANTHGISYLQQAISNGAVAVLSDKKIETSIPSFIYPNPREIVGSISRGFGCMKDGIEVSIFLSLRTATAPLLIACSK